MTLLIQKVPCSDERWHIQLPKLTTAFLCCLYKYYISTVFYMRDIIFNVILKLTTNDDNNNNFPFHTCIQLTVSDLKP